MTTTVQTDIHSILFPPGRVVQGDLYIAQQKKDDDGKLVLDENGQPILSYFFALAIQKTFASWGDEAWGRQVVAVAQADWPQGQWNNPDFAWKIEDGDNQRLNKNHRRNCDREGHPGHWIVKFSSRFPVKLFDTKGNPMIEPGLVKCGFYVEVLANVKGNDSKKTAGIYMNHSMVAYRAPGKEIISGPDPRAVGFGQSALPPGVTDAPVGNTANLPSPVGAAPAPYVQPTSTPAPYTPPSSVPAPYTPPTPPPLAVAPNPGFIAPGAGTPTPPPPPPPVADPMGAPAGYKMADPSKGRYESFRAANWSDEQMVQHGHMVKL